MKKDHLSRYNQRYAEPMAIDIADSLPKHLLFEHAIVIPACDEDSDFVTRLQHDSTTKHSRVLVIIVINQHKEHAPSKKNQQLWQNCLFTGTAQLNKKYMCLLKWEEAGSHLLIVDCFSSGRGLPSKQGVGLARKIGCDIACRLAEKKQLSSNWIHTTDADVMLPNDYLQRTRQSTRQSAIYPFRHVDNTNSENTILLATQIYETALHYYVAGLAHADSPYAYHSLGSCIAVQVSAYAQVRGFPKRAAGEDFYLLNKLRKLDDIDSLDGQPIEIQARISERTPFGTGIAVKDIVEKLSSVVY